MMHRDRIEIHRTGLILAGMLILAGCARLNPTPAPAPDEELVDEFGSFITATGVVIPVQQALLSLPAAGVVTDILVAPQGAVAAGQPLIQLDTRDTPEQIEAAVASARMELFAATVARNELLEHVALRTAQAQLNLASARDALKDAEYRWRVQQPGLRASGDTINAAEANLVLAEQEVKQAQQAFDRHSGRPEDDPQRALALSNLSAARQHRDAILRQLNWYKGSPTEIDQQLLDAEVALARAQYDEAEAEWLMLQQGPDPDALLLAEERVANARAQLAAAQASLEALEDNRQLQAPFAGTVVELLVEVGEWVTPGQPAAVLARVSELQVETTDLGEIDVAQLSIGDPAIVTFDALPGLAVNGHVTRIALKAAGGSGVNYPVLIELDEIPVQLLWGMTAFVDIPVGSD